MTFPLDDLGAEEIADAVALLTYLRALERSGKAVMRFASGTPSWRVATALEDAGYLNLRRDGCCYGIPVYRVELRQRRATR